MANIPRIKSPHDDSALNTHNRTIDTVNQISRRMQDLVAKGQLTPAQYAEMTKILNGLSKKGELSIHDIDKNKGLLDQSFLSEELLQQIAGTAPILSTLADGTVTTRKIANKAVSADKTDFLESYRESVENLTTRNDLTLNFAGGAPIDPRVALRSPSSNLYSYHFKAQSGSVYTLNKGAGGDRFNVMIIKEDINQVGGGRSGTSPENTLYLWQGNMEGDAESHTLSVNESDCYIFIQTNLSVSDRPEVTVERNQFYVPDELLETQPGAVMEKIDGDIDGLKSMLGIKDTPFQGDVTTRNDLSLNFAGGTPIDPRVALRTASSDLYSYHFKAKEGTTYKLKKGAGGDRFNVMVIAENIDALGSGKSGTSPENTLYLWQGNMNGEAEDHTLNVTSPGSYIFIQTNLNGGSIPDLTISEIQFSGVTSDASNDPVFNLYGDLSNLYRKREALEEYFPDPLNLPVADYHQRFNTLVDAEELFKSTLLGEAEGGHDLYMYENIPPKYEVDFTADNASSDDGRPMKIPKITITAGVHGYERSASIALYYLFKELHENPNDDPMIELIKMNVHIIAIPIVCPSGFEGDTYGNINGKNINREFPPLTDGPTEKEAVLVNEVIMDNLDMDFFIDFHNINSSVRRTKIGFTLTNNPMFKTVINNMYRMIGREWQKEHPSFPQNKDYVWAHNAQSNLGTIGHYTEHVHGIPSVLVELPRKIEWLPGELDHEPTSRLGVEYLVNTIAGAIRSKQ